MNTTQLLAVVVIGYFIWKNYKGESESVVDTPTEPTVVSNPSSAPTASPTMQPTVKDSPANVLINFSPLVQSQSSAVSSITTPNPVANISSLPTPLKSAGEIWCDSKGGLYKDGRCTIGNQILIVG